MNLNFYVTMSGSSEKNFIHKTHQIKSVSNIFVIHSIEFNAFVLGVCMRKKKERHLLVFIGCYSICKLYFLPLQRVSVMHMTDMEMTECDNQVKKICSNEMLRYGCVHYSNSLVVTSKGYILGFIVC